MSTMGGLYFAKRAHYCKAAKIGKICGGRVGGNKYSGEQKIGIISIQLCFNGENAVGTCTNETKGRRGAIVNGEDLKIWKS